MEWMVYQVGAAVIGAGNALLDKRLAMRPATPSLLYAASFGLVSVPVVLIGLPLLPPVPWSTALTGILAGMLFMVAAWLYYDVLSTEAVSQVALLMRLGAIKTVLLANLFLGEQLTSIQYLAFAVSLTGGWLLTWERGAAPLWRSRSIWLLLLVTTLFAIEEVLLTAIYREYSVWIGTVWESAGQILGTLVLLLSTRDRQQLWQAAQKGGWSLWGMLVGEQGGRLAIELFSGSVAARGVPLALLSATSALRPLLIVLLAMWFFGERWPRAVRGYRLLGMGYVFVGVWLVAIG